jgi:hypothetical protein
MPKPLIERVSRIENEKRARVLRSTQSNAARTAETTGWLGRRYREAGSGRHYLGFDRRENCEDLKILPLLNNPSAVLQSLG